MAQEAGWQESFDDPHLPGWEHSPEAIVVDGILRIGPGNFAARMGGWADFDLTVKVRFSGPGETVILYREADRGGYALRILVSDMVLFREIRPDQQRELDRSAGWTPSEGAWMDFRITVQQGRHSIAVDGNEILSAEDPEPLDPGIIVFASHGERTTEVDEISLAILHSEGGGEPPVGSEGQTAVLPTATPEPTAAPNALQELWAEVTAGQGAPLETGVFAVNLLLSVVFSFLLSRVYIYWGSSLSNRRKFAANFMLVTVTTTFIILVVRSSVALSLGLVGALSIIRFRTAVKEPEELAYLFFAISLGIGLGDNQRLVTLLSFMVVVLLIGLARLLRQTQADINLHLTVSSREPGKIGMSRVREVLEKHCAKLRLIRYDENPDQAETSFVVEFRHISDLEQARASLRELSPEMEISFLDNKGIW
ncbi:MAG: DUF4956 domain-containing protein [Anaerolineales bacterium]|nr:DUF4956 domain-containing protein [Anaerolineales bacterium]